MIEPTKSQNQILAKFQNNVAIRKHYYKFSDDRSYLISLVDMAITSRVVGKDIPAIVTHYTKSGKEIKKEKQPQMNRDIEKIFNRVYGK